MIENKWGGPDNQEDSGGCQEKEVFVVLVKFGSYGQEKQRKNENQAKDDEETDFVEEGG
jgi:hypothetical protein